jgi:thioesterase CepJ
MEEGPALRVALATGISLSCTIHGTGLPVLLLGGPHRAQLLEVYQVPLLTRAGYQVVTADHRGMPPSDVPPPPYSVEELAADVASLIEWLGLAPCAVVGYSLGAFVLQELVITRPELVARAVFCGARMHPTAVFRAVHDEVIERLGNGSSIPPRTLGLLRTFQLFGPRRLASDSFVTTIMRVLDEPPAEGYSELGLMQASLAYVVRPERLATIRLPCLVIGFEHDIITPPHQGRQVAGLIPGCHYAEIAKAGHGAFLEKPTELSRIIVKFLAREPSLA